MHTASSPFVKLTLFLINSGVTVRDIDCTPLFSRKCKYLLARSHILSVIGDLLLSHMTLRLKIAPPIWLGSSLLPATCHPGMTGQAAGAIFSLNLMFKRSFRGEYKCAKTDETYLTSVRKCRCQWWPFRMSRNDTAMATLYGATSEGKFEVHRYISFLQETNFSLHISPKISLIRREI